jgi:hypothetical protein
MKGKICVVIAIVLLVLSLITASVVMAQTLKYAPAPQELPLGFYYTSIETGPPQILALPYLHEECGVRHIYGESVELLSKTEEPVGVGIFIAEFLNIEDAKECYLCYFSEFSVDLYVTEIDAFGDESIGGYAPVTDASGRRVGIRDEFFTVFRNDKFIAFIGTDDLDELNNSKIVVTDILPKIIDEKLEQVKAPTPTPTPSIPAFQIIHAIATLLAVAYLLRRRK